VTHVSVSTIAYCSSVFSESSVSEISVMSGAEGPNARTALCLGEADVADEFYGLGLEERPEKLRDRGLVLAGVVI
jgi:hypothetical protein